MPTLKLEIVTPEAKTYSEDVDFVLIPGSEGDLGVYPGHVPLLTELAPGELKAIHDGKEVYLAIGQGFVEITQTTVSVLTDMAVMEDDIDEDAAVGGFDGLEANGEEEFLRAEGLGACEGELGAAVEEGGFAGDSLGDLQVEALERDLEGGAFVDEVHGFACLFEDGLSAGF